MWCRKNLVGCVLLAASGIFAQIPGLGTAPPAVPAPVPPGAKRSPLAERPDWSQLGEFSGVISREEFDAAYSAIYSDGSNSLPPWKFATGKVIIDTGPGQAPLEIAFRDPAAAGKTVPHYWHALRDLAPLKPKEPPLTGVHIALDPGHIGGGYSKMEERWLSMTPDSSISEGSLTFQVASIVKPRLEALGARVSLVRGAEVPVTPVKIETLKATAREILKEAGVTNPRETYGMDEGDTRVATLQWQTEKLFYRVSEIHARARRVNEELRPDLVICLHFNAEPWGDPAHPAFVDKNHFHLLINGAYTIDELGFEDIRFEMFFRLFSRLHDEETRMAGVMAAAMAEATGLPPYIYTTTNARHIKPSPYVWARNLLANRIYHCPVMYLEPYVMNNEETYNRLLMGHYIGRARLGDRMMTSAMEDYARGVVDGLLKYSKQERRVAP